MVNRTLQPGDDFSRYRIIGPLGAGGMGEVYRARDASLERDVALKVLPPSLVRSEERVRRFMLEARSASSLNHPNIVTIYEIGEGEVGSGSGEGADAAPGVHTHFISMELVSGDTLGAKIHEEKTDLKTLLGWLAQAAEGVAKAHAAGIVHRDLKPGNIMISNDGYAKVLDFGLAKLTEKVDLDAALSTAPTEIGNRTTEGVVLGTVGYMSPEQVRGKGVDARTDIFSLGCILYEAATRRRPFVAESSIETMHQILNGTPIPIEERNPEVPAELRRLIRRCLAKNADQRLQSVKDLAIELREIVDDYDNLSATATSASGGSGSTMAAASSGSGAAVGSGATTSPSSTSGAASPRRIPWVPIILTAVVAAGVALGVTFFRKPHAGGGAPSAELEIRTITSRGDVQEPVISPDGRYLAYLAGAVDEERMYVRQIATGTDVEVLPPQEITPIGLSFSRDGNYLYFLSPDPEHPGYKGLYQIPSLGGEPRKRAYDVDSPVSFSPDGSSLVFMRGVPSERAQDLIIMNVASGEQRTLSRIQVPEIISPEPAWSPDGATIAIPFNGKDDLQSFGIGLFRVSDGQHRRVKGFSTTDGRSMSLAWMPNGKEVAVSALSLAGGSLFPISLVSVSDGSARRLTGGMGQFTNISASADGSQVAASRFTITSNLWTVDTGSGRTPPRQLTFTTGVESAVGSHEVLDDGTIVYLATENERNFLASIAPGASNPRNFRPATGMDVNFRCRPGIWVFEHDEISGSLANQTIWRMDPDGSNRRPIGKGTREVLIDVSADGRHILYFDWSAQASMRIMNADGTEDRILADDSAGILGSFSPDGERVLYMAFQPGPDGQAIMRPAVRRIRDGQLEPIAPFPPSAGQFQWIADNRTVGFIDTADPAWNVFRRRFDGGPIEQVTRFTDGRLSDFDWSRDNRRLVVQRHLGAIQNYWIVDAASGDATQLTDFQTGDLFRARWSADGARIVFTYGDAATDAVLIGNIQ